MLFYNVIYFIILLFFCPYSLQGSVIIIIIMAFLINLLVELVRDTSILSAGDQMGLKYVISG